MTDPPSPIALQGTSRLRWVVPTVVLLTFIFITHCFWVPAHAGLDENVYLVAGKSLAARGTAQLKPGPHEFVGRMWVTTDGRAVPKYPLGLPTIVALVVATIGTTAAYWISPVAMTLGLVGCFQIARRITGPWGASFALLMLSTSPVVLALANDPNSHATDFAAVTWGMYSLLRWWERGGLSRAMLAGALLGSAATIRYTEALLVLPAILVVLYRNSLRDSPRARIMQPAALFACWAVPIGAQLAYNRATLGLWTAYALTNESSPGTAFSWLHFAANYETVYEQLYARGLYILFPVGLVGLGRLLFVNRRLGLLLCAWFVPAVVVYTAYYWMPRDMSRMDAARFFLTLLPPLAFGAAHLLTVPPAALVRRSPSTARFITELAAPLVILAVSAHNAWVARPLLAVDRQLNRGTLASAEQVTRRLTPGSTDMLLGPTALLNHLQFVTDLRLFSTDDFDPMYYGWLGRRPADQPHAMQPQRIAARTRLLTDLGADGRRKLLRDLAARNLELGKRVMAVVPEGKSLPDDFAAPTFDSMDARSYTVSTLSTWADPASSDDPPARWRLIELKLAPKPITPP